MKKTLFIVPLTVLLLLSSAKAEISGDRLPVVDGKEAVAVVDGKPITLDEFNRAIGRIHSGAAGGETPEKGGLAELLERMINTKLILLEAREMGLNELPDTMAKVRQYSKDTMIKLLLVEQTKDVEPDDAEVDSLYEESVKEYKVTSLTFENEEDAKRMAAAIEGGADFYGQAEKLIREGQAKENSRGEYLKKSDLLPAVVDALSKMDAGSASSVIPLNPGFAILKLEGVRIPEDAEARERAIKAATKGAKEKAVREFYEELKKTFVSIDEKLLRSLDFESKDPGLDSLLEDTRVIAEVRGHQAVTVGDLAGKLKKKYFHGVEKAIESKTLNRRKESVLEEILKANVYEREAISRGIDGTDRYKTMVEEYENSLIFDAFVRSVIVPGIKLNADELKDHYDTHPEAYRFPEMMRITSIAFEDRVHGEEAIDKLRKGTALSWIAENAAGRVKAGREGLLQLDGSPLLTVSLPDGMREAVEGAKTGDFLLHQGPEDIWYVLFIQQVFPPKRKPFETVRKEIAKEVFDQKIAKEMEGYAEKLREHYDVKIYTPDLGRK